MAQRVSVERRRRRSAAEWRSLMREYASSGVAQRAFCDDRGLAYSSFTTQWRKFKDSNEARHKDEAARPTFIPLSSSTPTLRLGAEDAVRITLELGNGMVLHIDRG